VHINGERRWPVLCIPYRSVVECSRIPGRLCREQDLQDLPECGLQVCVCMRASTCYVHLYNVDSFQTTGRAGIRIFPRSFAFESFFLFRFLKMSTLGIREVWVEWLNYSCGVSCTVK